MRAAARIGCELARGIDPALVERAAEQLRSEPAPSGDDVRLMGDLTGRMVAYVGGAEVSRPPVPRPSGAV